MIYRKHYDNVQLEGEVKLGAFGRNLHLRTLVAAGVCNNIRFVELIMGDTTFRMYPNEARELATMLNSAAHNAEIMPAERSGGPIYVDEGGDLFEQ